MYYLQSRYYDPVTGRFLNADIYIDTGSGSPLSTNMFAYCENDAINKCDKYGEDACWIQAPKSVPFGFITFGHTSLLIQEKKGVWWYYYWGGKSVQLLYLHTTNLKKIDSDVDRVLNYFKKTSIFKSNKLDFEKIKRTDKYTQSLWFKGEFATCLEEIKRNMKYQYNHYSDVKLYKFSYSNGNSKTKEPQSWVLYGNHEYKRFICNCMQRSIQVLFLGKLKKNQSTFISRLCYSLGRCITPNFALDIMHYGIGIFDKTSIGIWSEI